MGETFQTFMKWRALRHLSERTEARETYVKSHKCERTCEKIGSAGRTGMRDETRPTPILEKPRHERARDCFPAGREMFTKWRASSPLVIDARTLPIGDRESSRRWVQRPAPPPPSPTHTRYDFAYDRSLASIGSRGNMEFGSENWYARGKLARTPKLRATWYLEGGRRTRRWFGGNRISFMRIWLTLKVEYI